MFHAAILPVCAKDGKAVHASKTATILILSDVKCNVLSASESKREARKIFKPTKSLIEAPKHLEFHLDLEIVYPLRENGI